MKICVIVPIISRELIKEEEVRSRVETYVRLDTEVDFVFIDYGPASIESRYDHDMAAPFVIKKAEWAEANGYDAVVVSCMMDPGVKAAKEALEIPVVGPGEAATRIANILGEKVERIFPRGLSVLELVEDPEKTYKTLLENAKKALEGGAQVLILGCTGLTGMGKRLQEELGVPVLEGEGLALGLAQLFVDVGLSQSKLTYRKPPEKKRILPGFED
ncbi:MAG: aspartate/glutamate racemase family protein [Candidatus Bathyarchaeia archaeon]